MGYFVNMPIKMLAVGLLLWLLPCSIQRQAFRLQPEQLCKWRKFTGWSQEQMVEKISQYLSNEHDSFDLKTYQRWERGERQPHVKNYIVIQKMFQNHDWYLTMEQAHDIIYNSGYEIGDEVYYPTQMREQILHVLEIERRVNIRIDLYLSSHRSNS